MATPIFFRNLEMFFEAEDHGGADGSNITSVTDLSGNNRNIGALSNYPTVKTNAVNSKRSFLWDGSKNPLVYSGSFPLRCGWLVVKQDGNFAGSYAGILSSPTVYGILAGIGGSALFYDFQYDYYEYRLNDRIYPAAAAPAPVDAWGIIYFKFWRTVTVEGMQFGQDRHFTDRKGDFELALAALYSADFCEEDVRKNTYSIANSYALSMPDVFPYQGSKTDAVSAAKRVLSDGQTEPVLRVKTGARRLFDLNFSVRPQEEMQAAEAFWNDRYPQKRFIYRDYQLIPPEDTIVRFPEGSEFERRGGNTRWSLNYGFRVFESTVAPATAIPAAQTFADDESPLIVFDALEPAPGGYSGDIIIFGSTSDNVGVVYVQFYVDDIPYGSPQAADYWMTNGMTIDTTLFANGNHDISAKAVDTSGNVGTSSTLTLLFNNAAPDTEAPTVPTGLNLTVVSSTQINVAWNASTDNVAVTGYDLQRATDAGFTTNLTTINLGNVLSYNDTGLSPSTTYHYRVRAHDGVPNNSAYSASQNAATDAGSTLANNLVSYWKLDEASGAATDAVGSNDLTANNAPGSAAGQVDNCRTYDHASLQWHGLASPSGLAPGLSDFSISFWVNYTGDEAFNTILNWGNQSASSPYLWIYISSGTVWVQFVDGLSGFNTMNTGVSVTALTWTHLTFTFDRNGNLTTYKNGVSSATNDISGHQGDFTPSTGGFGVGSYYNDTSLSFDGNLDELKWWSRLLTTTEITEDYDNGVAGNPLL